MISQTAARTVGHGGPARNAHKDLKESVYKLTDLETRFGLNMNVLDAQPGLGRTPMVMGLKELLSNWITSQIEILQRRSQLGVRVPCL